MPDIPMKVPLPPALLSSDKEAMAWLAGIDHNSLFLLRGLTGRELCQRMSIPATGLLEIEFNAAALAESMATDPETLHKVSTIHVPN